MTRIARRIAHAHIRVAVCVFALWIAQGFGWLGLMLYVQFADPHLGNSVLYVTQISQWALVLSCGVAATAGWGLIANKSSNEDVLAKIEALQEEMYEHLLRSGK